MFFNLSEEETASMDFVDAFLYGAGLGMTTVGLGGHILKLGASKVAKDLVSRGLALQEVAVPSGEPSVRAVVGGCILGPIEGAEY